MIIDIFVKGKQGELKNMETITVKIYKKTHDKLKLAHVKDMSKRKKAVSFVRFTDDVITAGLKEKGYKRFSTKNNA